MLADSPKVEVEVNHVASIVEKFKERVTLFLKFSKEDKFNYQKFLLEKRLAELKYIIDGDNWDPIEETSSRYATNLGNFNNFVVNGKLSNNKTEILNTYERHSKIIEELQRNFEFNSAFWMLLEHDINTIKIFSSKIQESL